MKNKKQLIAIAYYIAAICYFLAAVIDFTDDNNGTSGFVWLPFGIAMLIIGTMSALEQKKDK